MANERKGTVLCRHCEATAEVRVNVKRKLYYVCPSCGILQATGQSFQDWILEHATMDGAPPSTSPPPKPADLPAPPPPPPSPQPAPEPAPPKPRKASTLFD